MPKLAVRFWSLPQAARWLNLLTAVSLLCGCVGPVAPQYCGIPGVPGIPGPHGQHGKDGLKGEEGDPGEPSWDHNKPFIDL